MLGFLIGEGDFLIRVMNIKSWRAGFPVQLMIPSELWWLVSSLGSMSSIAISYGQKGPVFCSLKSDGSHFVTCYRSNLAIIYGTPAHFPFVDQKLLISHNLQIYPDQDFSTKTGN